MEVLKNIFIESESLFKSDFNIKPYLSQLNDLTPSEILRYNTTHFPRIYNERFMLYTHEYWRRVDSKEWINLMLEEDNNTKLIALIVIYLYKFVQIDALAFLEGKVHEKRHAQLINYLGTNKTTLALTKYDKNDSLGLDFTELKAKFVKEGLKEAKAIKLVKIRIT